MKNSKPITLHENESPRQLETVTIQIRELTLVFASYGWSRQKPPFAYQVFFKCYHDPRGVGYYRCWMEHAGDDEHGELWKMRVYAFQFPERDLDGWTAMHSPRRRWRSPELAYLDFANYLQSAGFIPRNEFRSRTF